MGRYTVSGSGARCKRVVFDSGGSTPSLPTINQKYSKLVTGYKILKNRCAIRAEVKGPPRVEILYKKENLIRCEYRRGKCTDILSMEPQNPR